MNEPVKSPNSRQEFDAELMGVLNAICIVSKRLAAQLSQLSHATQVTDDEGGEHDEPNAPRE